MSQKKRCFVWVFLGLGLGREAVSVLLFWFFLGLITDGLGHKLEEAPGEIHSDPNRRTDTILVQGSTRSRPGRERQAGKAWGFRPDSVHYRHNA